MRMLTVTDEASLRNAATEAARVLRDGGLVAFPTETVYGLGADASDARAVERIFAAKGRPSGNPLIVHVAGEPDARALAREWPTAAATLAKRFWPGPLTLVVEKTDAIPAIVTAGGGTVGLRVPAHPVALAILREANLPIAAPSANRSTAVSPTRADHVIASLGDRVDLVIDGGPTSVGIESTVVDVTVEPPQVLRPGMIGADEIAGALDRTVAASVAGGDAIARSPGLGKHYSPRGEVRVLTRREIESRARERSGADARVGAVVLAPLGAAGVREIVLPREAREYARGFYAALHELDRAGCSLVLIERPPDDREWAALLDRIERAAAG